MKCRTSPCPVSRALDVLGDPWSLLIIRDMLVMEKRQFSEFLDSPEGIATNILTSRLNRLIEAGLVVKVIPEGQKRASYEPTKKAIALGPVLKAFAKWGSKHQATPSDGSA
ncbi:MAG: winged helix-turn-helix transcriptional regulator [Litorivicinus sp.]